MFDPYLRVNVTPQRSTAPNRSRSELNRAGTKRRVSQLPQRGAEVHDLGEGDVAAAARAHRVIPHAPLDADHRHHGDGERGARSQW